MNRPSETSTDGNRKPPAGSDFHPSRNIIERTAQTPHLKYVPVSSLTQREMLENLMEPPVQWASEADESSKRELDWLMERVRAGRHGHVGTERRQSRRGQHHNKGDE